MSRVRPIREGLFGPLHTDSQNGSGVPKFAVPLRKCYIHAVYIVTATQSLNSI